MSINLGDLSQGEEAVDRAMGNSPANFEIEDRLSRVARQLHYKDYEAKIDSGFSYAPWLKTDIGQGGSEDDARELRDRCISLIAPLIEEWNESIRKGLVEERARLIKQLQA
jgi:hypothetical protein